MKEYNGSPENLMSRPIKGKRKVTNIYWDQDTQQIVIEHDD